MSKRTRAEDLEPASHSSERPPRSRAGRKRDPGRDDVILDAALAVLADYGYEGMTIDMVAARANSARATVYRRWATKADLVLEAVRHMSRDDVSLEILPDTAYAGHDRHDPAPQTTSTSRFASRPMAGLLSLSRADERLAAAATGAGIGPWIEANRILMQRAIDRGEFPSADVYTLADVISMMCVSRAVQRLPITREFSLTLIDGVIIPALRGG